MLRRKLFHRNHRHHCALYHLLAAGAGVAGVAAFLSPDFVSLLTGFFSSFLSAAGTGASALVTAGVATGALADSAANADTANAVAISAINCFI